MAEVPPGLVVGCGYLGGRVAAAWRAAGRGVFALTRDRAAELTQAGLTPVVGDVTDPASLERLRELPPLCTLLYAVGFDRRAGRPMRDVYVGGLANVLAALPPVRRVIYVSSTGVYGQTGGEWVTEDSPTVPLEESGRVVLAAEDTLRRARPDAMVLRFAGIYGPDRLLRGAAVRAGEPYIGDADKFLNLIHVADGVRAVLAAEANARPGSTFNIADGTPVTRCDFYTTLAELLHAPPAAFRPAEVVAVEANRRIDASRARAELGFVPVYPTWREGLAEAVGSTDKSRMR